MIDVAENMLKASAETWPLSAAQKGIWLGQQLSPQSPLYNTAECYEISGWLDLAVFERSLRQTVAEAETLNLRFDIEKAEPVQVVETNLAWPLQFLDLQSQADPRGAAWAWMEQTLKERANLRTGDLFAQALIQIAPDRYLWYLRIHHIAIDGYGYSLLLRRAAQIYTALMQGQTAPPSPFGSLPAVLAEDAAYQTSEQKQRDRTYWLNELAAAPAPVSWSPKTAPASGLCLRQRSTLPPEVFERLQAITHQSQTAWPDMLLAVTAVSLHRATGATELIFGLPMMGRLGSAALRVPAMVMNIVPLRLSVRSGSCFLDLVKQIGQRLQAMQPHRRYRYEQLRRDLNLVGGERRLFGPIVNIMPFDNTVCFGEARVIAHPISAGPVEDLAINIRTHASGQTLKVGWEGNPACYSLAALAQQQQQWLAGLHAALEDPHQVIESPAQPVTSQAMRAIANPQISPGSILRGAPLKSSCACVLDKFIEQVSQRPHAEAVVTGDSSLSYRELLKRAQALGSHLITVGVKSNQVIAIHLPRSHDAIVAILGVLFSGAAYLALDPAAPSARNASLLRDAQPALLITQTAHRPQSISALPPEVLLDQLARFPATAALSRPQGSDLAYMVYTSGSTGQPKGVMIDHLALASFVSGALQRYEIRPRDRVLQFASLHFDASVEEILLTLCSGATLVLSEDSARLSLPDFLQFCQQQQITLLDLPTAFWHELAFCLVNRQATLPESLRMVIIGGEAALPERINQWHSVAGDTVTLLNTYGPSETTVVATVAELLPGCADEGGVPIGQPLPGVEVMVIDAAGGLAATGQGELYVTGPTLARGYWGKDQLTADRFVQLAQLPGKPRAYRTGDQVLRRQDGQLVFVGRLDAEFKISGHRINPAEIESALSAVPGIREAAVVGYSLPQGIKRLCAYLVADTPYPAVHSLRQQLSEVLPAAVIPAGFNFTDALPKTASGKIDRAALHSRSPEWITRHTLASPSSLEALILRTWEAVLGQPGLTVQDDFFEVGGQSLQTIQVTNWLSAELGREVSVSTIFRHPTAVALARALDLEIQADADRSQTSDALFAPLFPITAGDNPLFCVHPAAGISWCYMGLARALGQQHPLYGVQSPCLSTGVPDSETSPEKSLSQAQWAQMIEQYIAIIRQVQPAGAYRLLGWSFGGMIAQAIATRLQRQGGKVELLALLDAYPAHQMKRRNQPSQQEVLTLLNQATGQPLSEASSLSPDKLNALLEITRYNIGLARQAPLPEVYQGNLLFFTAKRAKTEAALTHRAWQPFISGTVTNHNLDVTHGQILADKAQMIAQVIAPHIRD